MMKGLVGMVLSSLPLAPYDAMLVVLPHDSPLLLRRGIRVKVFFRYVDVHPHNRPPLFLGLINPPSSSTTASHEPNSRQMPYSVSNEQESAP